MFKILFYHANTLYFEDLQNSLFLSVAALYFKTHLETHSPEAASNLQWLRPIQKQIDDDELVDYCNSNNIDLLCISMYLWNADFLREQLSRIRSRLHSKCKIVVGGPSIDVNINSAFFQQNSYADFAVYGPGEAAFTDLVTNLVNKKNLIAFNVSNLAWHDTAKDKLIVADYKNVPQSQISPFLSNKEFFKDMVEHEINHNKLNVILPYELTRGCPYACTFCDWNSGLSNKVSRRKNTYKEEIDLFQQLGIRNIYFSDANFGQYEEDIDLVEYMVHKNLHENAKFKTDGNLSKLRKDNNLKIYHLFAKGDLVAKGWGFTFSVQDINENVLKNIERPDVGWPIHKKMIQELYECHPQYISKVQFIVGLPGQTPTTIKKSLKEIISLPSVILCPFISELLPASPAGLNPEYQQKFQFTYSTSERINDTGFIFRGKFPQSCVSFTQKEFVEMVVLVSFMTGISDFKEKIKYKELTSTLDINILLDIFLNSKQYQILTENLYNNWVTNDKFFYTIDFNLNEKNIPACHMAQAAYHWSNSIEFKKMLVKSTLHSINTSTLVTKITKYQPLESWFPENF